MDHSCAELPQKLGMSAGATHKYRHLLPLLLYSCRSGAGQLHHIPSRRLLLLGADTVASKLLPERC
jgi:hypothetical protein